MRLEVRSFRLPGWLVPLLGLAALALLPFALLFALGIGVLALGAAAVGALLKGPPAPPELGRREKPGSLGKPRDVIDAEYEVKDEKKVDDRG